jgi:hypothetical protein
MAQPTTRATLKEYCLRKLGKPVVVINVEDGQAEDRIDDALDFWHQFHSDGYKKIYLPWKVTQTNIDNKYIDFANDSDGDGNSYDDTLFLEVTRIFPLQGKSLSTGMFNAKYQWYLANVWEISRHGLTHYDQIRQYMNLLDFMMNGERPVRFNRHENILNIDMNWSQEINVGDFMIMEAYWKIDTSSYTDVWNDQWLKKYTTALIKRQWGENLKKFEGVQMVGGVEFNGQKIWEEAIEEIEKLETEAKDVWEGPYEFFLG